MLSFYQLRIRRFEAWSDKISRTVTSSYSYHCSVSKSHLPTDLIFQRKAIKISTRKLAQFFLFKYLHEDYFHEILKENAGWFPPEKLKQMMRFWRNAMLLWPICLTLSNCLVIMLLTGVLRRKFLKNPRPGGRSLANWQSHFRGRNVTFHNERFISRRTEEECFNSRRSMRL